ncbi:MAG: hypothetical protein IJ094_13075 [Bacilli bacterium]|nr:hypothetical protein [Bacilli bacterium]
MSKQVKKVEKISKHKNTKDITEQHDNSVIMSFSINNLTEKDVNTVINTFDKIQKDFKNNVSSFYVKTSSNSTKKKGKPLFNFGDF